MKIEPKWIALADELPEHNMNVIVGNVNRKDPENNLLGEKWVAAGFVDRQKLLDEGAGIMKAPLAGPRFVFTVFGERIYREPSEFTHWWPIPKPFGQEVGESKPRERESSPAMNKRDYVIVIVAIIAIVVLAWCIGSLPHCVIMIIEIR